VCRARGGGRDIEDHDLVSTLCFVPRRLLGGVSGVAQILKPNAFYDRPSFTSRHGMMRRNRPDAPLAAARSERFGP